MSEDIDQEIEHDAAPGETAEPETDDAGGEADRLADEAAVEPDGDEAGEDGSGGDEDEAEAEAEDKPKRLTSSQRKSRKIAAQARELAAKEAQIAALLERLQDGTLPGEAAPEPPRAEDFETDEAWREAVRRHEIETTVSAMRRKELREAAHAELMHARHDRQLLARRQFADRLETARPQMPQFDDKVETLIGRLEDAGAEVPQHVVEQIQASSHGPEILYLMAGDDGFLLELLRSDPVSAARAIGRREALLAAHKSKTTTKAPAPLKAPKGGSAGAADPATMSYRDYRKWRGFDTAAT